MKTSHNPSASLGGIGTFARKFHTILFFLVISGGLFAAIILLLSIINLSSSTASSSDQVISGSFDQATIERLEQNSTERISPAGRPSPFTE